MSRQTKASTSHNSREVAIESLAPSVKDMSEVNLYELAEKIFALSEVKNLIAKEVK